MKLPSKYIKEIKKSQKEQLYFSFKVLDYFLSEEDIKNYIERKNKFTTK